MNPLEKLRHHVTGAIERGEKEAIIEIKPTSKDRVILRRCRNHPQNIIAFLPDVPANPGNVMSYEHLGQHGEASLEFYRYSTAPIRGALPYDALALLSELRGRGYELRVMQRMQWGRG